MIAVSVALLGGGAAALVSRDDPDTRTYRGLTSEHLPVELRVTGDRLAFDIRWVTECVGNISLVDVERTRSDGTAARIRQDGRFAWTGRFTIAADGASDPEMLPLRLSGRVRADGSIAGAWRIGDATSGNRCPEVPARFTVRRGGSQRLPPPRAAGDGVRATPLADTPEAVVASAGRIWVAGASLGSSRLVITEIDPAAGRVLARSRVRGARRPSRGSGAQQFAGVVGRATGNGPRSGRRRFEVTRENRPPRLGPADVHPNFGDFVVSAGNSRFDVIGPRVLRVDGRAGAVHETLLPRGRRRLCPGRDEGMLLAVGGGSVWVATGDGAMRSGATCPSDPITRRLVRVDPRKGGVTRVVGLRANYSHLAVGAGGLWAVVRGSGRRSPLHRIDPVSGRPLETISLPMEFVSDLTIRDGTIWLAGDARAGNAVVVRVRPGRDRSEVVWRDPVRSSRLTNAVFDRRGAWILDIAGREVIRVPLR